MPVLQDGLPKPKRGLAIISQWPYQQFYVTLQNLEKVWSHADQFSHCMIVVGNVHRMLAVINMTNISQDCLTAFGFRENIIMRYLLRDKHVSGGSHVADCRVGMSSCLFTVTPSPQDLSFRIPCRGNRADQRSSAWHNRESVFIDCYFACSLTAITKM